MKENANCSISNIYKLDGRVPIGKAIPFGLQHILAMFVSNLAPITMIAGAAKVPVTGAEAWYASSERNVRSRYRNDDPVISFMEDRIQTSRCNGCQLYLRNCT